MCPRCGTNYRAGMESRQAEKAGRGGGFAPEKAALNKGVLGGVLLIVIAVVWFVLGMSAGYIFYYPPILALIGVYGIFKGLSTGNLAGKREPRSARRRR
jgi:hypothetical protein